MTEPIQPQNSSFEGPYEPGQHEGRIYKKWLDSGLFNPDNLIGRENAETYVVYMPLPNVTGSLHMGHALDNTLQDISVRYERMRGKRTLWLPGTDHAGIATQFVVEKDLRKQGISRFEIGREAFIEKVWEWKKLYGGMILEQLKRLGCSADWSRTRFTMDAEYAKDVQKAFVHYYEKKLLYRDYRTVNWCPRCGTSLSELELEYKDEESKLWYIRYSDDVVVATTRPETMLGDTAIAVNPNDERFKALVGKTVTLPIVNREIPIVPDELIDPKFGTGMVKVTPAHDANDFEIGRRHNLPTIQVIDERARMTVDLPDFKGLKTTEAREKIVAELERLGKIVKIEPYAHNVAICYRCSSVIEPIPSMQWFLRMRELADIAMHAVKSGAVKINPERFEKPYFDWLSNIRDWTISRQIWWGHRIPVWTCAKEGAQKDDFVVSIEKPASCPSCGVCEMEQAPDVLDTWFSSALWPFAGLSEEDKKKYYPGNTLITARDILNLWVARMIYSGVEYMGSAPFKNVLIHGTIMTKEGKRMSKSLGTGIDPLKYIDEFGADVARFAVVWQATGQDIRWDETAVTGGRKFTNKIWNASKFVIANQGDSLRHEGSHGIASLTDAEVATLTDADKDILSKLESLKGSVGRDIEAFEFSKALHDAYDFFWHEYCDVYLEISKEQLKDEMKQKTTRAVLYEVLLGSLTLMHPFMPFITEAIFERLPEGVNATLLTRAW